MSHSHINDPLAALSGNTAPRVYARIDHEALRHNARAVQAAVGSEVEIIAIVKADGYGHGGPAVARTLAPFSAQFGVANLEEARAVRALVPDKDILILSPCLPEERRAVVAENFVAVVSSAAEAADYSRLGGRVHLCLDTGMGRIGIWQDEALAEAAAIAGLEIEIESISTHLPAADSDPGFTAGELEHWSVLAGKLRKIFPRAKFHALNSAASFAWPEYAADRVRPGLALYGVSPLPRYQSLLRPAMTLVAHISLVRDVGAGRGISYGRDFVTGRTMRVATLTAGYADGYPRQVSGHGAHVLVGGRRCPVLGRVTMDQFMIDVSDVPAAKAGDEAVLFGCQGQQEIPVGELADWSGTISWDIFTRLGRRVRLVHENA